MTIFPLGSARPDQALKKSGGRGPYQAGTQRQNLFLQHGCTCVKNTGGARNTGYDAAKKVSGIKRHILLIRKVCLMR
jgi:hypothetical protein